MGTNYYWVIEEEIKCFQCHHITERRQNKIHIGKSSVGWCFSLHVYPNKKILDLYDWIVLEWAKSPGVIEDEYGENISLCEMLRIIIGRGMGTGLTLDNNWYVRNYATPGPFGLARHALGHGCVKHGEGTWDCLESDFS